MSYELKRFNVLSDSLQKDWELLIKSNQLMDYSSSLSWCITWWNYFGCRYDLDIHVIYKNGIAVCILPLYRYKDTLYSIGTYPDNFDSFSVIYSDEKALPYLWNHLISEEKAFELRYIKSESLVAQTLIKSLYSNNSSYHSSVIDLQPYTNLDAFKPKKKLRDDIKRCKNRISELFDGAEVKLEYHTKSETSFNEFVRCHIERWDGGPLQDQKTRIFWRDLYLNTDMVMLTSLTIADRPIAWMLCIIDNDNKVTSVFPAYIKEYSKHSPGKILCFELINSLIQKGFEVFDFGRGAEGYKFWFNHKQNTLVNIKYSESFICKILNHDKIRLLLRKFFG